MSKSTGNSWYIFVVGLMSPIHSFSFWDALFLQCSICFFITILPLTLLAMETKEILEATCEALLLMPDLYISLVLYPCINADFVEAIFYNYITKVSL